MQIRPEQKVGSLAEGDAQSPQRALDPRPLTDTPAIRSEAPKKVQERVLFFFARLLLALNSFLI